MPTILEVDGLVKTFGDHEAVKGVSFSVEEGEVFGLLGPNGAGKTTIISMLTGVLEPTAGTARIGGYDIRTGLAEVKKINGLVPQDLALYPTLSARANLAFFGRTYGLRGRELKERVEDVLRVVALTDRADEAVEKYSGGMKRRVNIAAGLVHQPRLLFLDEPTVGVDPQSRNHIFESVMRLNRDRRMSIVYTSHYMEEVELLCSRVAIIDRGEIIALDTIKNLIALLGGGIIQVGLARVDDALLADMAALPAVREATLMPPPVAPPPAPGEDGGDRESEPLPATPVVKVVAEHSQQAIVIPASFTAEIDAYTPTAIDVIVDPGDPERASIIAGIMNQVVSEVTIWGEVQYGIRALLSDSGVLDGATVEQRRGIEVQTLGAIMTTLNEVRRTPLLTVSAEDLAGQQADGGWEQFFALLFPGFAVLFVFFSVTWSSAGLLVERETGTLRRLLASPIPRGAIVAGKNLAFALLCCTQTVLLLGVGSLFFNMPLGRSPFALVILTLVVALTSTAMGMLVAALAKSSEQASNIGVLLGFLLGVLGGCISIFSKVPLVRSEGFLGVISNLTPQGHAVDAYFRLMAENGTFLDILPRMGILLAIGIVFYGVAAWRLRFE